MGKTKKHEKKSKKKHKHKDRKEKKEAKKLKKKLKELKDGKGVVVSKTLEEIPVEEEQDNFAIPVELMNNKSHAPETPEEYQRRQSKIRRETDPVTGRIRLIKGDGEVLEEMVSKERHVEINKSATQGDGRFFQEKTYGKAARQSRN